MDARVGFTEFKRFQKPRFLSAYPTHNHNKPSQTEPFSSPGLSPRRIFLSSSTSSSSSYKVVVSCLLATSPASGRLIWRSFSGEGKIPVGSGSSSSPPAVVGGSLSDPSILPSDSRLDLALIHSSALLCRRRRRGFWISSHQPTTMERRSMRMNVPIPVICQQNKVSASVCTTTHNHKSCLPISRRS